jgi:hypothetical protein
LSEATKEESSFFLTHVQLVRKANWGASIRHNEVNNTLAILQKPLRMRKTVRKRQWAAEKREHKNRQMQTVYRRRNSSVLHILHEYAPQEQHPNHVLNNVNAPIFMSKQE